MLFILFKVVQKMSKMDKFFIKHFLNHNGVIIFIKKTKKIGLSKILSKVIQNG